MSWRRQLGEPRRPLGRQWETAGEQVKFRKAGVLLWASWIDERVKHLVERAVEMEITGLWEWREVVMSWIRRQACLRAIVEAALWWRPCQRFGRPPAGFQIE